MHAACPHWTLAAPSTTPCRPQHAQPRHVCGHGRRAPTTTTTTPLYHLAKPPAAPAPQVEVIRSNLIGCLNLADVSLQRGVHMTYFGTGCIFHYDDEFVIGGKGFKEEDKPNFTGSYYSYTKVSMLIGCARYAHMHTRAVRAALPGTRASQRVG